MMDNWLAMFALEQLSDIPVAWEETVILVLGGCVLILLVVASINILLGRLNEQASIETERELSQLRRRETLSRALRFLSDIQSEAEEEGIRSALRRLFRQTLGADRCAVLLEDRIEFGRGKSETDELDLLEKLMRELARTPAEEDDSSEEPGWLLRTSIRNRREELIGQVLVGRLEGKSPFDARDRQVLEELSSAAFFAHEEILERRREQESRVLAEESEGALDEANRLLAQTKHFGLQGQLAQHLIRELTGPITGIVGLSEFLELSTKGSPFHDDVHLIQEESQRCRQVLEQFNARSMDECQTDSSEEVDLALMLGEVLELTSRKFADGGVTLRSEIPRGSVPCRTKPPILSRILTDLAGASLEFAEHGVGEVRVSLLEDPDASRVVFASSTDPGKKPVPTDSAGLEPADLWQDFDSLAFAVVETMSTAVGGRLKVRSDGTRLLAILALDPGRPAVPLHASAEGAYRDDTKKPGDYPPNERR